MTPEDQAAVNALTTQAGKDVAEVMALVKAYKTGGKEALMKELPNAITAAKDSIQPVKDALPVIKAGYKTTEFWLVVALGLGNILYTGFTGKTLPIDLNATLAALVGIYTAARASSKNAAVPTPPTVPTVTTTTSTTP